MAVDPVTPLVAEPVGRAPCGEDAVEWDVEPEGEADDVLLEPAFLEDAQVLATLEAFASCTDEEAAFELPADPMSLEAAEQRRLSRGLASVHEAMCREQMSFREARLAMVLRAMEEMGADATGMPTDPKAFTLEKSPRLHGRAPPCHEGAVLSGYLQKRSRLLRVWRSRWTVLTERRLCTYKSPEDAGLPYSATEVVNLEEVVEVRRRGDLWVVVYLRPRALQKVHNVNHRGLVCLGTDSQARSVLGQSLAQRRSFVLRLDSPTSANRWFTELTNCSLKARRDVLSWDAAAAKVSQQGCVVAGARCDPSPSS